MDNKISLTIYTLGHSTHPIEEFIELLKAYEIGLLMDVRTIPQSRYNPQFAQNALRESLSAAGVRYGYMKDLGGLRPAQKDSINTGWRNKSFRNYADYMQSEPFKKAVAALIREAESTTTAIMCAEAVPWRCHRSLVGDALLVRGVKVIDIISLSSQKEHALTPFAHVEGEKITYPEA